MDKHECTQIQCSEVKGDLLLSYFMHLSVACFFTLLLPDLACCCFFPPCTSNEKKILVCDFSVKNFILHFCTAYSQHCFFVISLYSLHSYIFFLKTHCLFIYLSFAWISSWICIALFIIINICIYLFLHCSCLVFFFFLPLLCLYVPLFF